MIGKKMNDALNNQINEELFSSYLYLSMSAWLFNEGWNGMGMWMLAQAKEENEHAMKIFRHIVDRGGKTEFKAIKQPQIDWESPLAVFKDAQKHEEHITDCINKLVKLSDEESDYPAHIMLHWFVEEQVEEESSVGDVVQLLERIGGHGNGLVMLDQKLGQRK